MSKYTVLIEVANTTDLATLIGAVANSSVSIKQVTNGSGNVPIPTKRRAPTRNRKPRRSMTIQQVFQAKDLIAKGWTIKEVAQKFDVGATQVGRRIGRYKR